MDIHLAKQKPVDVHVTPVSHGYTYPGPGSTMANTREGRLRNRILPSLCAISIEVVTHSSLCDVVAVALGFIRLLISNSESVTPPGRRRASWRTLRVRERTRQGRYYACRKHAAAGFRAGRNCSPDDQCGLGIPHQPE